MPTTPPRDIPATEAIEHTAHTMLSTPLISPAAGPLAAIVGTPPTAQRSAGDGSPAADSFAMALNQASSPPPPAPSPTPASAQGQARADAATTDAPTASDPATTKSDPAVDERAATQRRALTRAGREADAPSPHADLPGAPTPAPAPAEAGPGALPLHALDAPAAERADEAAGALPGAADLLAARVAPMPAALSRAGAGAAGDAPAAAPMAAVRRGETGAEALAAAGEREPASRPSTPAAASTASPVNSPPPATATALPAPAPVLSAAVGANAPTAAEARLQASPGSAEFAPALGAQLNVFLRDGVQHARLQLHPAELGPLTVQIQLDGATAQVRLAAEHPLTRQALEQAMPTLASSLRESGLTLTGGGVFEQPAHPQPQQDDHAAAGGRAAQGRDARDTPAPAEAAPLRAAIARRGVVDLVA